MQSFCRATLCIARLMPSCGVCSFVRPSVCQVHVIINIFLNLSPTGSCTILVFLYQKLWQYSHEAPSPLTVASNTGAWVWENRYFRPIFPFSVYFWNDTGCGHNCNERRIQTRIYDIKRCHFQWPWVTSSRSRCSSTANNVKGTI